MSASKDLFNRRKKVIEPVEEKTEIVRKENEDQSPKPKKIIKNFSLPEEVVDLIYEIRSKRNHKGDNSSIVSDAIIHYHKTFYN